MELILEGEKMGRHMSSPLEANTILLQLESAQ